MPYIGKVTAGGNSNMLVGSTLYGNCTTAAGTAAKIVNISGFDTLLEGVTIHVRFANANTATNPTLNVTSTGALPIYRYGDTVAGTNVATSWPAKAIVSLTYQKTDNASGCWVMNDHIDDTNTSAVTGIKGGAETTYRTGDVNITAANVNALALTGGTVTGNTTVQGILTAYREGTTSDDSPAHLRFSTKDTTTGNTYSSSYIAAYQDHNSETPNGANMVLHPGGAMFIGAGEAAGAHYQVFKGSFSEPPYQSEAMYITSDSVVNIQGGGNTIENRKGVRINSVGNLVPIAADEPADGTLSLGISSCKWNSVYAITFYGNLSGNATTATTADAFSASKAVTLTGDVTGTKSSTGGWSVATTLANSGVTAGSYGPSANATPAVSGTFDVPYITVDAKGRLTAASTKTVTIPSDSIKANLASPTFTGTPKAPTAASGTNTTQIATTAFVTTAVANGVASAVSSIPTATTTTPKMDGTAAVGSETKYAKGDHVHPSDTTKANLASPTFTGTPKAPTASSGTNNTQIATTAFVNTAITDAALPKTTSTPQANVDSTTGVIGTETKYAAGDHQHPAQTYVDSVRHVGAVNVATAIAANRIGVYDPTAGGYVQLAANVEFSLNWPILYFPTAAAVGSYTNARLTYPAAANSGASSMTVGQQTWLRLLLTSEIDRTVIYVSTVKTVADTKTNPYIYIPLGVASTSSAIYFNPAQYGSVLINQPGYIVG